MKVLHLIGGGDIGGAKVHVLSLVNELSKHIDVKIISFRSGIFTDDARSMGIDIEVVKTGNIFSDVKRVASIINNEGIQLIHSHGAKANMVSILLKRHTHIPTVTTVHSDYRLDYMHSFFRRLSFGTINSIALRFIDYYVGVSNNFKRMLIDRNFNPENIFTVYNGMDFGLPLEEYSRSGFAEKYKLNMNDNDILVGITARLNPVKGIDTLIDAASLVVKQNPSVKFIIGGDGEQRKALERKAISLGLTENIFFVGWLNDPYELMSIIDISVLTSISESFPYSILEGARSKKATISSRVGGIPDLIDSGDNGYLFNPGDHEKLAEYIVELATNHSRRVEMGKKIFIKASTYFSLKKMCSTQLDIYSSILANEGAGKKFKGNYDIIISGYYGFKNLGDDALLLAIINNLKNYKNDIKVIVLSSNPLETKRTYSVNAIGRLNFFRIIKSMKRSKLFVYGGGTLIQESTSTRSLIYYLGTMWIAKKMGLKTMLYANGIEPINKSINRRLTQKVVNNVDIITLRETPSMNELQKLDIKKPKITVTADTALTIQPASIHEVDEIFSNENIDSKGPFVGFSARKWDGYKKYEAVIAQIADHMIDKYSITPVFIPMQYPDDLVIIKSIVSKMTGKGHIIKSKYSVPQTIGIISRMDMLIGMRLHALVFAAAVGTPIIGLVYEPKVEWFLQHIGQENASAGNINDLNFEALRSLVDNVWQNRDQVRNQLDQVVPGLKQKALENAKIAIDLINDKEKE